MKNKRTLKRRTKIMESMLANILRKNQLNINSPQLDLFLSDIASGPEFRDLNITLNEIKEIYIEVIAISLASRMYDFKAKK